MLKKNDKRGRCCCSDASLQPRCDCVSMGAEDLKVTDDIKKSYIMWGWVDVRPGIVISGSQFSISQSGDFEDRRVSRSAEFS